ncbi:hypothetical protein ID875_01145 [Streptomyces globisporus]|uniref:Uncharacterized protein n=1 Tax=Streptomyces globisporus TaxID=1908 RepID=A0A927BII1_STRGL|nr:hypothetical protein [Streptomyces globisporus]
MQNILPGRSWVGSSSSPRSSALVCAPSANAAAVAASRAGGCEPSPERLDLSRPA